MAECTHPHNCGKPATHQVTITKHTKSGKDIPGTLFLRCSRGLFSSIYRFRNDPSVTLNIRALVPVDPPTSTSPCTECGTWICQTCWDFRRPRASRTNPAHQICPRCGGTKGEFLPIRHLNPGIHSPRMAEEYGLPTPENISNSVIDDTPTNIQNPVSEKD